MPSHAHLTDPASIEAIDAFVGQHCDGRTGALAQALRNKGLNMAVRNGLLVSFDPVYDGLTTARLEDGRLILTASTGEAASVDEEDIEDEEIDFDEGLEFED